MKIKIFENLSSITILATLTGFLGLWSYSSQQGFDFWYIIQTPGLAVIAAFGALFLFLLFISIAYIILFFQSSIISGLTKIDKIEKIELSTDSAEDKKSSLNYFETPQWALVKFQSWALITAAALYSLSNSPWLDKHVKFVGFFVVISFVILAILFSVHFKSHANKENSRLGRFIYMCKVYFYPAFMHFAVLFLTSFLIFATALFLLPNFLDFMSSFLSTEPKGEVNSTSWAWYKQSLVLLIFQLLFILFAFGLLSDVNPKIIKKTTSEGDSSKSKTSTGTLASDLFIEFFPETVRDLMAPVKSFKFLTLAYVLCALVFGGLGNTTRLALVKIGAASHTLSVEHLSKRFWDESVTAYDYNNLILEEKWIYKADELTLLLKGSSNSIVKIKTCKNVEKKNDQNCSKYEIRLVKIPTDSVLLNMFKILEQRV